MSDATLLEEYRLFVDPLGVEYRVYKESCDALRAEFDRCKSINLRALARRHDVPIVVATHMWNAYRQEHGIAARLV